MQVLNLASALRCESVYLWNQGTLSVILWCVYNDFLPEPKDILHGKVHILIKKGNSIKSIRVSSTNSGTAGLANDKSLAFSWSRSWKGRLGRKKKKKMNAFRFRCLSRLFSVPSWNWQDLPPKAIMKTRPPGTGLKHKGAESSRPENSWGGWKSAWGRGDGSHWWAASFRQWSSSFQLPLFGHFIFALWPRKIWILLNTITFPGPLLSCLTKWGAILFPFTNEETLS